MVDGITGIAIGSHNFPLHQQDLTRAFELRYNLCSCGMMGLPLSQQKRQFGVFDGCI